MNRRDFLGACAALYRLRGTGSLLVTVVGFQRRSSTVLFDNHYQSYRTCEHPDFSPFRFHLQWELDPFGQWYPSISETGFEERNHLHHQMACLDAFLERNRQAMRLAVNASKAPGFA
jgi:hypothetical protein